MQEPDEKEPINSGLMKEISGGDTVTCRALHAMPVTFTPMYTPILMCNAKPHVNPQDEAVWRRLRVVDFPVKFVYNPNPNDKFQKQRDDTLKEKIKLWPSAFMYKLLSYYKMYVQDEKLEEPEPILRFTTEYQKECDHFSAFFDEHIEKIEPPLENVQPESTLNTIDRLFKTWVLHQNIAKDQIPNKKDLQKMLEKKYGNMELDGHRKGWYNIRTKEDDIF
jgi:putative DNA primase/helicase